MDGSWQQHRGGGPTSSEQIMETGAILLRRFICDQIGAAAKEVAQLALEQVAQNPDVKELMKVVKRIAQQVDSDKELQRLLETLRGFSSGKFSQVARQIFLDGISWGKIVTLFCFASKLVLKVLDSRQELITSIMGWTLDFIRKRLLPWIQEQGGWDGLLSRHSNQIMWLAVAVAIIAVAVAFNAVRVDFTPKQRLPWPWPWILEFAGWDGLLAQHSKKIKWLAVAVAIIAVAVAIIAVAVDFIGKQPLPCIQDGLLSRHSKQIMWLAVAVAIIAVAVAFNAVRVDFTPKQRLPWPWPWILEFAGWDGLLSQHSNQVNWLTVVVPFITVAVSFTAVLVAIIAVAVDFI